MIRTFFRHAMIGAYLFSVPLPVSAQTITDGVIFLRQGDKVPCKMIRLNKRLEEEAAGYAQVQVLDSAGIRTYLPADLLGYVRDGVAYKAFNDKGYAFFAKCLVDGPSTLFFHPGGYGEDEERGGRRYFFKKKGEVVFFAINTMTALPKWIGVPEAPTLQANGGYSGNALPSLPIKKKDTRFIEFFSEYLKDCQAVVRKIKTEFYTIDDIQTIFEEFNACQSNR